MVTILLDDDEFRDLTVILSSYQGDTEYVAALVELDVVDVSVDDVERKRKLCDRIMAGECR